MIDRRLLLTLTVFVFILGAFYLLFLVFEPFLPALAWAAVIAAATFPLYERMRSRFGGSDNWAALGMTLAAFLVIMAPSIWVMAQMFRELLEAQQSVKEAAAVGGFQRLDGVMRHPMVAPWVERANQLAAAANLDLKEAAIQGAKNVVQFLLNSVTQVVKNLFFLLLQLLLILLALFFVYKDGRRLNDAFWQLIPLADDHKASARQTVDSVVSAVVVGVLVTALVQGVLGGIGFWFCGLPSPLLFGVLTFVSAFIPVVGTALIWGPGAVFLMLSGEMGYGITLLIWGAVVVSGADSVLRPLLISERSGLPLPLMMVGALGGLLAFGFLGIVLGPLVIALFLLAHKAAVRWRRARLAAAAAGTAEDAATPSP